MIKKFIAITCLLSCLNVASAENKITNIELNYIDAGEVVSVLSSLVGDSVKIAHKDNILIINGAADKTENIVEIVKQMDNPPTPLTIEFIASSHNINFNNNEKTYQAGKSNSNISQSMSITERQWVTLNTGLSIPVTERKQNADGTESLTYHYKKVSKNYVFKVHEFSGWSVIQVGMNASSLDKTTPDAIRHTRLDTTIVGKTGEWLEVASTKNIHANENTKEYSTSPRDDDYIHLYVKVISDNTKGQTKETK